MKHTGLRIIIVTFLIAILNGYAAGQESTPVPEKNSSLLNINGVFPHLSLVGDHQGRSETGIGALIPWAGKLWMIGYVAHISGSGIGLYEIDSDMTIRKHPESITGTFANRMIHDPSNQAIIGPHLIDTKGNVRTIGELSKHRLTATMTHLSKPDSMVYFLTMEGLLYETNVYSLRTSLVEDLVMKFYNKTYRQLYSEGIYTHFKGGFTGNGRVIVANNAYQNEDYIGRVRGGRLAEWDGKQWTVIDSTAYMEIKGKMNPIYGNGIWATGWDRASVKLMFYSPEYGRWRTYRLPKGSQAWEHAWNTEWMRIREAQTERFMMDMFGIFYELPVMVYGGNMLSIKPVCNHLRVIPDFTFWRGLMVLAGDQVDNAVGQPQSNLQFINIDDLWQWGKPSGFGSVWKEDDVAAFVPSDPFLMNGFDKKVLNITHKSTKAVRFRVEVDLSGNNKWVKYKRIRVPAGGYRFHVFPDGFSAQWVRIIPEKNVRGVTAEFKYN